MGAKQVNKAAQGAKHVCSKAVSVGQTILILDLSISMVYMGVNQSGKEIEMMHSKKDSVLHSSGGAGLSRRAMLLGGTVLATAAAVPGMAQAALGVLQGSGLAGKGRRWRKWRRGEGHLGRYLCGQVHHKMALELDDIIADPAIDGEGTAKALMEARCPGCGQRVQPATSSISAVVPQWQWHEQTV